jgi:hypothetical protein
MYAMHQIVGASIIGGAIIIATGLWIYFSPFQTCMRQSVNVALVTENFGAHTWVYCTRLLVSPLRTQ